VGHCAASTRGSDTLPQQFMSSGMLFKEYHSTKTFIIKKTNGILIPFIFFYLVGCIGYSMIQFFASQLLITTAGGIMDLFCNRQFFNGPIWFIIALFWCNIYFYIIKKVFKNDYATISTSIIIGIIGWFMGAEGLFVPMFLDVAMTSLPFFALGYYINKTGILNKNINNIVALLTGVVLLALSFIIPSRTSLHYNIMQGANSYIVGLFIAAGILFLCKAIKRVPFVTYCGRYSIVLLCVHHMIYRPLMVLLPKTGVELLSDRWSIAIITLLLSVLCIPVCKKLIPWFVAQKDLIKLPRK
jgi:fucose 4-O-acetylase-like acetyltransferase